MENKEIMSYYARPIECTGKVYRLIAYLTDGNYVWHPETGTQEEIYKLTLNKNRELMKGNS